MRKRTFKAIIAYCLGISLLAGCGLPENIIRVIKSDNPETATSVLEESKEPENEAHVYTEDELKMLSLELKLNDGVLTESEYVELANLYEKLGFIKCERDVLEQAYRLFKSEKVYEKLQNIAVNLEEEDEDVVSMALLLYSGMSGEKDLAPKAANMSFGDLGTTENLSFYDAIDMLFESEWQKTMMPKLYEGKRTYYAAKAGKVFFVITVGFDENGNEESSASYIQEKEDGSSVGTVLSKNNREVKIYEETSKDAISIDTIGGDSGDRHFMLVTINPAAGTVRSEEGTLKNGYMVGDLTVSVSTLEKPEGEEIVYSPGKLLKEKENMPAEIYTGSFYGGIVESEVPSEATIKALAESLGTESVVVYAYNKDKTKCLFKGVSKEQIENGFSFGVEQLSLTLPPLVKQYDTKDKSLLSAEEAGIKNNTQVADEATRPSESETTFNIREEDLAVRIFDGVIQIFNGSKWIDMGSAGEIAAKDPFSEYEKVAGNKNDRPISQEGSFSVVDNDTGNGSGAGNSSASADVGAVIPDTSKGSSGSSSGTKPSTGTKPPSAGTQTPAPQVPAIVVPPVIQVPVPAPSAPSYDDDDRDDTPSYTPPPSNPDPAPSAPDPAPSTPDPEPSTPDPGPSEPSGGGDSGGGGDTDIGWSPDLD